MPLAKESLVSKSQKDFDPRKLLLLVVSRPLLSSRLAGIV